MRGTGEDVLLNVASRAGVSVNLLLGNAFIGISKSTLCYKINTLCCAALSNDLCFPIEYMTPTHSMPVDNAQRGIDPSWDKAVIKDIKSIAINYSITLPILITTLCLTLDDNVSLVGY